MKPSETCTQDWIARYRANTEYQAPDDERRELNEAIKKVAFNGCKTHEVMQRAAGLMLYLARSRVGGEPLHFLKEVCDVWDELDVESFLIVVQEAKDHDVD